MIPAFGKHFSSMYTGSMRGKGSAFFAVWGYVIAHARPDWKGGMNVELNPEIIGWVIGEDEARIKSIINEMCEPDKKSRTADCDGRKLIRLSEYTFKVVNGIKYRLMRDEFVRKDQNRESSARYRAKKRAKEESADVGPEKFPPKSPEEEAEFSADLTELEKTWPKTSKPTIMNCPRCQNVRWMMLYDLQEEEFEREVSIKPDTGDRKVARPECMHRPTKPLPSLTPDSDVIDRL